MASASRPQLTEDSGGLRFTYDGKYAVFWSRDGSIDDAPANQAPGRCSGTTYKEVYWIDGLDVPGLNSTASSAAGRAICISVRSANQGYTQASGDAEHPYLSQDGRYIGFDFAHDGIGASMDGTECTTVGRRHIYVHDRKWEFTSLSQQRKNLADVGACTADHDETSGEPNDNSYLFGIDSTGQKLLLSTDATNQPDNVEPPYEDNNGGNGGFGFRDIYTRDGGDCINPSVGECKTTWLMDDYDLHTGTTTVAALNGDSDYPAWNSNGSIVVFQSFATVPVFFSPDDNETSDIFMWKEGRYFRISQSRHGSFSANETSSRPSIDSDGRYIAYQSLATDLVETPVVTGVFSQIYLHDRTTGITKLISKSPAGAVGDGDSVLPRVSGNGRYVAFDSRATNLVSGVTINPTGRYNVYLYDLARDRIYLVTEGTGGTGVDADATTTDISDDGLYIGIQSRATNLLSSGATNGRQHVFIAANGCPADTDGDGTPDCIDDCPADPIKSAPQFCGCGVEETDSDSDGTPDCVDLCSSDAEKTAPGVCGCGTVDTDTDGDGTPDCNDRCIGTPDTDANGNGAPDCVDPTAATVPSTPAVSTSILRGRASVRMQAFEGTVNYTLRIRGAMTMTKRGTSSRINLTGLRSGNYQASYTVSVGGVTSRSSAVRRFRIR